MSSRMKNAPVYFTIAQIRFNPILSLQSFVPGIQESFRKHGFADFKKALTMTLAVTVNKDSASRRQLLRLWNDSYFRISQTSELRTRAECNLISIDKVRGVRDFYCRVDERPSCGERPGRGTNVCRKSWLALPRCRNAEKGRRPEPVLNPRGDGFIRSVERTNQTHVLRNISREPRSVDGLSCCDSGRPDRLPAGPITQSAEHRPEVREFHWDSRNTRHRRVCCRTDTIRCYRNRAAVGCSS